MSRWGWFGAGAVVGVAATAALGIVVLRATAAEHDAARRAWRRAAEAQLADSAKAFRAELARLADTARSAHARARRARQEANAPEARVEALEDSIRGLDGQLDRMSTVVDSLHTYRMLYEQRTRQQMETAAALAARIRERDALQLALQETERQRDLALQRVVQLEQTVTAGMELADCRVMWVLPCPPSATAFAAGVVVGVVSTIAFR